MVKRARSEGGSSRRVRHLCVALCAAAAAFAAIELAWRHVLFAERPVAAGLAKRLRVPSLYAAPARDDLYWQLDALWPKERLLDRAWPWPQPPYGWVKRTVEPETLAHADEAALGERRPVLLFGDSFANCVTPPAACFEGLFERCPESSELALLNYGTSGYGTDQSFMLLRAVLARHAQRDPVVVFSFLLDDDLDRAMLKLRQRPKPRFALADGELQAEFETARTPREYLELHPPRALSWTWRYLMYGRGLVPESWQQSLRGDAARLERLRELNRAIFAAAWEEITSRGLEGFFLIFHGERSVSARGPWKPHEAWVCATLRELGIPFVSTRRDLLEASRWSGGPSTLFVPVPLSGSEHYTARGNAAALGALLRGLAGNFQAQDYEWPAPEDDFVAPPIEFAQPALDQARIEPEGAPVVFESSPEHGAGMRVAIEPGARSELEWILDGSSVAWTAMFAVRPAEGQTSCSGLRIQISTEREEVVVDAVVSPMKPLRRLNAALYGCAYLRLVVSAGPGPEPPGVLVLRRAEFW